MNRSVFAIIICICAFQSACAPSAAVTHMGEKIIGNITFYPQEDYQCGPASLAAVLDYWGLRVTPEEIAGEIFSKSAGGTLNVDMMLYAQRKGLYALEYRGSVPDLRENIDAGHPVIVMVDNGVSVWQKNHFMVVVGYNDDGVIVNSGQKEHQFIDSGSLVRSWSRTNYWSLLVVKK